MVKVSRANRLLRDNALSEAVAAYRELIDETPQFYLYHENCGIAYKKMGDTDKALQYFASALRLNPNASRSYEEIKNAHKPSGIKLSVIVPVHNSGQYLTQCLESILHQDETSIELIVINDGSNDESLSIIREMMKQDERIVLINNTAPSGSPGRPRNQAIEIARGEYLGFVDSDDWVDLDFFSKLLQAAEKNQADMVFSGGFVNHVNGQAEERRYSNEYFNNSDSILYRYHESFMIWDKIYRTSLVKYLPLRLGETSAAVDVPFILKAYYYLSNVYFASEIVGYHYRRESASSVTVRHRKLSDCDFEIKAYESSEKWCQSESVKPAYRNVITFRKIRSFVYTLSLISPDHFEGFYNKVQNNLRKQDETAVTELLKLAGKGNLFEKYQTLLNEKPEVYYAKFVSKEDSQGEQGDESYQDRPVLTINGPNKGILFFPGWVNRNPYLKLFYSSLASNYKIRIKGYQPAKLSRKLLAFNKDDFSYLHVHWLNSLIDTSSEDGAEKLLDALSYAKELGYKILYTAHNIVSHESLNTDIELKLRKQVARYFDCILVHGDYAKEKVISTLEVDPAKVWVMPHGGYCGYYPNFISKNEAREKLNVDKSSFVFLFFGNIRGYKGVDDLLSSYSELIKKHKNTTLIIAGGVLDNAVGEYIQSVADVYPSIIYCPGFIEEGEVQDYFNAADMVILPYKKILTSGAIILSYAFKRPVIAPKSGLIPEYLQEGLQGFMFEDIADMQRLMERCVTDWLSAPSTWHERFVFESINKQLLWPKITAQTPFPQLFSRTPSFKSINSTTKPHQYALIRILGNDLPIRHTEGQTLDNLKFTLQNESEFDDCIKIWVINRIVDPVKKDRIIALLDSYDKQYIVIPYTPESLASKRFSFEDLPMDDFKLRDEYDNLRDRPKTVVDNAILKIKNNYIINNNGARNRALLAGRKLAYWVFPWDGNCFVTDDAWAAITHGLHVRSDLQYHIVAMERVIDNGCLLRKNHTPQPSEEPQVIFRHDAELTFDEYLAYGLQPKVDMLKRLAVPGKWDNSNRLYPWSFRRLAYQSQSFNYAWTGWVARLFSGNKEQEIDRKKRTISREKAIVHFITHHDKAELFKDFLPAKLAYYDEEVLAKLKAEHANGSVQHGSALSNLKSTCSNYLSDSASTLRDETALLPIQRLFNETTVLALGGYIFSEDSYTEKAYSFIRTWFLDPDQAMSPDLYYAQAFTERRFTSVSSSEVPETEVIVSKDFYFFLDAVRLLKQSKFWTPSDDTAMKDWCGRFLSCLIDSEQGKKERRAHNNAGNAYDLQTYALAAFVGNVDWMYETLIRAQSRLKGHFDTEGGQPHELLNRTAQHHTAFNLQLWLNLNTLLQHTASVNLFESERAYGEQWQAPLQKGTSWLLGHAEGKWSFQQTITFDADRYQAIFHTAKRHLPSIRREFAPLYPALEDCKVVFAPDAGIAPYWIFSTKRQSA